MLTLYAQMELGQQWSMDIAVAYILEIIFILATFRETLNLCDKVELYEKF